MAKSDYIISVIDAAIKNDRTRLLDAVKRLIEDEKASGRTMVASQIERLLSQYQFKTKSPSRDLNSLVLPDRVVEECSLFIMEHQKIDLLLKHSVTPRHKILLYGPPGNGKTALAEAIANELGYNLLTVFHDEFIDSYLGATASKLNKIFHQASTQKSVLFLDEIDAVLKERGDNNDVGEMKRVVSSVLLRIDQLPYTTIFIGATNHPELLDRAVWRRFQLKLELPPPDENTRKRFLARFDNCPDDIDAKSFAEIEEICIQEKRKQILKEAEQ